MYLTEEPIQACFGMAKLAQAGDLKVWPFCSWRHVPQPLGSREEEGSESGDQALCEPVKQSDSGGRVGGIPPGLLAEWCCPLLASQSEVMAWATWVLRLPLAHRVAGFLLLGVTEGERAFDLFSS